MRFKAWLESLVDPQWEFDRLVFEKRFPELQKRFRNLTFQFNEKSGDLYVFKPLAPEDMDKQQFIAIAKKHFGKAVHDPWVLLMHPTKGQQLMKSPVGPEHLDDYPHEVTFDEFATGYIDAVIKISDIENLPKLRLYHLLEDFEQKGEQLAQEAEEAWASAREKEHEDLVTNRRAEFMSTKHSFPKEGDPIVVHDSKYGETLTGHIEKTMNNYFVTYQDGRQEMLGSTNQIRYFIQSKRLIRGTRSWEFR